MKPVNPGALIKAAIKASSASYSPYSRFPVGAALLTADGRVVSGCNVENASYGMTLCAERVALLKAVSAGKRKFKALAVAGGKGNVAIPCGACLQVLAEFCGPDLPVYLVPLDKPGHVDRLRLGDLMPRTFRM